VADLPRYDEADARLWRARRRICLARATTPAGLACQLRVGLDMFSERPARRPAELRPGRAFRFERWAEDLDDHLYANMIAGAEALAGGAS
ncbi:MAG: hypothetical protein AAF192_11900, partial [Pseudomonadota bacterium]